MTLLITFIFGLTLYLFFWKLVFARESLQPFFKKLRYRTELSSREKHTFKHDFELFLADLVRLIQAGIPLNEAITIAAKDGGPLIQEAILMPLKRIAFGETPAEAWGKATEHFNVSEFETFALVLQVQQEVGGRIADLVGRLLDIQRSKAQLAQKIKSLTAEGRLSGILLSLLPPGVFAALYFLSPSYIHEFLSHAAAVPLMAMAVCFWMMGVYFLVRLTRGHDV